MRARTAVPLILLAAIAGVAIAIPLATQSPPKARTEVVLPPAPLTPTVVCGSSTLASPYSSAPAGSTTVAAGNDSSVTLNTPGTTYWFAPGTHTLGTSDENQIIPGSGDTYYGAPGAILSGQQINYFAFTGNATNVTIEYLTIKDFGVYTSDTSDAQGGVVNQDSSSGWTIEYDTISQNGGAGAMLGTNNLYEHNCASENGQYGFQTYSAAGDKGGTLNCDGYANISVCAISNELVDNDQGAYNDLTGCGCAATAGKFWTTQGFVFANNYVHLTTPTATTFTGDPCIWADTDNSGGYIVDNYLQGCNAEAIDSEAGYFDAISNNTIVNAGWGYGPVLGGGFPLTAIYISESGYDSRAPGETGGAAQVSGNTITNSWGGVVLWENSNRFCGDGSDGYCTLVDPAATMAACPTPSKAASSETLYWDCRWRSQDVDVTGNSFSLTASAISSQLSSAALTKRPSKAIVDREAAALGMPTPKPTATSTACTASNGCGYNGVFSEYASYTPYIVGPSPDSCDNEGTISACSTPLPSTAALGPWTIPISISNDQHNSFSQNTYCGPWQFDPMQQGVDASFAQWQAGYPNPNGAAATSSPEDAGSTLAASCSGGTTTTTTSPSTTTSIPSTTTSSAPTTTTTTYTGPSGHGAVGAGGQSKVTSPAIAVPADALILVTVAGKGPSSGQSFSISGGGLTWTKLGSSSNSIYSEASFDAETPIALGALQVTATAKASGYVIFEVVQTAT